MDIIVNHSSMQPIYEQIGDQIKEKRRICNYDSWKRKFRSICRSGADAGGEEKGSGS